MLADYEIEKINVSKSGKSLKIPNQLISMKKLLLPLLFSIVGAFFVPLNSIANK